MRHWKLSLLVVLVVMLAVSVPVYAQGGGTGFTDGRLNPYSQQMAVYCVSGGVQVWRISGSQGYLAFHASPTQIGQALAQMWATHQHVRIAADDQYGLSLWALTSNELQATVRNSAIPQGYNFVFPVNTCGPVSVPSTYTPPTTPPASGSPGTPRIDSFYYIDGFYYTVRAGDNLFRIGLRFGIHYRDLARVNNIADPTRIYVGQKIFIPVAG
jgi:LysM repeat protein